MRHRSRFLAGLAILLVLLALVIWQGSFSVGDYGPRTPEQTYVFWGLSTLIFVLTVLLGFMLFRDAVKLYVARRAGQEGSRIRTKIVFSAIFLTLLPAAFLVIWSVEVLNRNLDKWFSRPAMNIRLDLADVSNSLERESLERAAATARWVASSREFQIFLATGHPPAEFFTSVCAPDGIDTVFFQRPDGGQFAICESRTHKHSSKEVESRAPVESGGSVVVRAHMPVDLAARQAAIDQEIRNYDRLASGRKETRAFYIQLLVLITLFVLFIAAWVGLFLARMITGPVSALLDGARAVRAGNLSHRVSVQATDELASLVRAFNEMTSEVESNRGELDQRRRFIETVLENIPTGVVSLSPDATIQLVNGAMRSIFPAALLEPGQRLPEILPPEYQPDFTRLLKRARRIGVASRQIDLETSLGPKHLSITVSALDARAAGGFVMVVEDTSELLRAQKAAAWHEVARRIAHELKNPLTPIALSSERIARQVDKCDAPADVKRIVRDCCATIGREVESVKTLVDEFAQFARWPAAQPAPCDLNSVIDDALAVFHGRLDGIEIRKSLTPNLPPVLLDREQFKRVIVNLVDNAAEAMHDTPVRQLFVETHLSPSESSTPDFVELIVADTGCGITTDAKEKLFLPYFSTKNRGTGLGLAIVSHIVAEHHAQIRVEDNHPAGVRFIIEVPLQSAVESETRPAEAKA